MEYEVFSFVYLVLSHLEAKKMRIQRRHLRDITNPFDVTEENFVKCYRLNQAAALKLIEELAPAVRISGVCKKIRIHIQVLATLHFLGHGSYQYSIGLSAFFSLSQPTMSRVIEGITNVIAEKLMPKFINFPTTAAQKKLKKLRFLNKFQFRDVIGVIDGTYVDIIAPSKTDLEHQPHLYINRKGRHSVNVMLICDADNSITAIDARYPGSVHDASVWKMSDIRSYLKNEYSNDKMSHLLGDSGYGLEPWLLTPYTIPLTDHHQRYNKRFLTARNVVERTIGILKARFRCLLRHRVLHYHPAKAAKIVYACAVLHNICQQKNIQVFVNNDDLNTILEYERSYTHRHSQDGNDDYQLLNEAKQKRNNFARLFF